MHPWFAEGLNPAVLSFNDSMVQISRDTPPAQEVLDEVWLGMARCVHGCGTWLTLYHAAL